MGITPSTVMINAGSTQQFTIVGAAPDSTVYVTTSGPGSFNGSSSTTGTADSHGSAFVTLSTQPIDSGTGTISAIITTQDDATTTVTATYNMTPQVGADGCVLGATVEGDQVLVTASTTLGGNPIANQAMYLTVYGANATKGPMFAGTTGSDGTANFYYTLDRPGTDTIIVTDSLIGTPPVQATASDMAVGDLVVGDPVIGNPTNLITVNIRVQKEKPRIHLISPQSGQVIIKVTSDPKVRGAMVTFEQRIGGRYEVIGTQPIGGNGISILTLTGLTSGQKYKFRAIVSATTSTTKGTTSSGSIRVS